MVRHIELPPPLRAAPFSVAAGISLGVTEKRMRGPDLLRPFHGVRAPAGTLDDVLSRFRAYAVRMRDDEVFSHVSAAALWGVPLPASVEADARVHVSALGGGQRPRAAGVVGHELCGVGTGIRNRAGLRVVDAATMWLQLAPLIGLDDLVAAGDHLVMTPRRQQADDPRPYATLDDLGLLVETSRARGKRKAQEALELVREGAESRQETRLRLALRRRGLPEPVLNEEILDARGLRIGFGDVMWPAFGVLAEYDGEQHRTDPRQFYGDVERSEALARAGWIQIRETRQTPRIGLRSAPSRAEEALRSRGWRPGGAS